MGCIPLKTIFLKILAHLQKSNEESRLISIIPASVVSYLEKTLIEMGKENRAFRKRTDWSKNVQKKPHETKKTPFELSKAKINPTVVDIDAIGQEIIERN